MTIWGMEIAKWRNMSLSELSCRWLGNKNNYSVVSVLTEAIQRKSCKNTPAEGVFLPLQPWGVGRARLNGGSCISHPIPPHPGRTSKRQLRGCTWGPGLGRTQCTPSGNCLFWGLCWQKLKANVKDWPQGGWTMMWDSANPWVFCRVTYRNWFPFYISGRKYTHMHHLSTPVGTHLQMKTLGIQRCLGEFRTFMFIQLNYSFPTHTPASNSWKRLIKHIQWGWFWSGRFLLRFHWV